MGAHLIIAYNKRGEGEIGLHSNYRVLEFKKGLLRRSVFLFNQRGRIVQQELTQKVVNEASFFCQFFRIRDF